MSIYNEFRWSNVVRHCITGIDGITIDPARVYGALAVLTFLGLSVYAVAFAGSQWDAAQYGIGFGVLLAGFGLGVQIKKDTEPPSAAPSTEELDA